MAFARRRPPRGVIFHSDRGSQYTSKDFAALARANGVRLSLGLTGCAYDNAVAESFFATIKRELITTRAWRSVTELRRAVFNYIEGWSGYVGDPPAAPGRLQRWVMWRSRPASIGQLEATKV